ncbi:MAG: response regulator [Bacteroidetes bacterium]|nr:response regulator [Bacteroidota bacterium]MBK9671672.1 response regulator [Bacteroidota bacterium]MBK9800567.1 response regulator [Bacteroidota bacterium]MBP6412099.1 response regulator [Bacteroidia bacterium]
MKTTALLKQIKVLLAEDDRYDRYVFEKAMRSIPLKSHITTVNEGEQLMNYLTNNTDNLPDVLFLDLSMPKKNGFECLFEIKENKKLMTLPVIILSTSYRKDSNYEQNLISTLTKNGAMQYIRKPDNSEALKMVLRLALNKLIEKMNNIAPIQ